MKTDFKNTEFYLKTDDLESSNTGEVYETPEGISVTADNYPAEVEGLEHVDFVSGLAPFARGPYGSMYVSRPWTIRQYAGFSTA
ncbi:MAG: methylmalonyl-CoA mutase, partial [Bacteroidia bacterium]